MSVFSQPWRARTKPREIQPIRVAGPDIMHTRNLLSCHLEKQHTMLGAVPAHAPHLSFGNVTNDANPAMPGNRWDRLAASVIFVLGSPRSGTTWLAKIFDSHPNILYRHEPDELVEANPELSPTEQVSEWLSQRGLRVAAKRPAFRKTWRPAPLDTARRVIGSVLAVTQRLMPIAHVTNSLILPDLIPSGRWRSVRAAIKLVNWDGAHATRTMPGARCVFILRHPGGQAASLLAGRATKQFAHMADKSGAPAELAVAAAWAARRGVDAAMFDALPDAAKFAWGWLVFNEPMVDELRTLPNAKLIFYEDLCRRPEAMAKEMFAFAGLPWHPQTEAFLSTSTNHERPAGYYDVFRDTDRVAERWRQTMSVRDQEAVQAVLDTSSLAQCWRDLATADV